MRLSSDSNTFSENVTHSILLLVVSTALVMAGCTNPVLRGDWRVQTTLDSDKIEHWHFGPGNDWWSIQSSTVGQEYRVINKVSGNYRYANNILTIKTDEDFCFGVNRIRLSTTINNDTIVLKAINDSRIDLDSRFEEIYLIR